MEPSPKVINKLSSNQIFVFGSNTQGRHGLGAAKIAMKWGAKYGQSRGKQGNTYAICTKDLRKGKRSVSLKEIKEQIDELINYAKSNPNLEFLVTKLGCGLAGYSEREISSLFSKDIPDNIKLPEEFIKFF